MKPPGIYATQSELFDLVDRHVQIEKIAGGFGSTGGPVFSRLGWLLFSDRQREQVIRWTPPATMADPDRSTAIVFREKSGGARGLTFDHQGRLLTCESGARRVTRTEKDGSITVLADRSEGQVFDAPMDLVYNIDGSVYFSDSPVSDSSGTGVRTNATAVYRIARTQIPGSHRVERVSQECDRPVGVALSPKQNLLYVSDAGQRNIRVHEIRDDGSLAAGQVFAEFMTDEAGEAGGLKTDESGNVYSAGPGGIWVFSSAGKHLGVMATPEPPSNCGWGAGFSGLYITAGTSVYRMATKIAGTRTF